MKKYAYLYWLALLIPACWVLGAYVAAWIAVGFIHANWSYTLPMILFIILGLLVRPLRPTKPEVLALMFVGLIGTSVFAFMDLMVANLVGGMLTG